MKILIADDDVTLLCLYHTIFQQWGHESDTVVNGYEAVKLINQQGSQYDLCLMDIEMPVMDGVEAIQRVRQLMPALPVIAASSDSRYKIPSLRAGANFFYSKPLVLNDLRLLVDELCREK